MSNYRIKTDINNPSDYYVNIKLEQDFDNISVLSMNLSQTDVYSTFASDTGVVVGRINSKFVGIPNAKVSLFIPITDIETSSLILTQYPFKTTKDTDSNGKRYNLLNRIKSLNPFAYIKENNYGIGYTPKTPVGSIPDKNELLVNDTWVEIYDKYYKFTTTTNSSGDYMFMNIPVGTYTLHAEFDITDIGKYSTPAPLLQKTNGVPKSMYNDDGSKLLPNSNLDQMPNIYSRDIVINVLPFWGDKSNFEIGVTRQDIDFKINLTPAFTVIGNGFTQSEESYWGDRVIFRCLLGLSSLCFGFNECFSNVNETQLGVYIGLSFKVFGKRFTFGSSMTCSGIGLKVVIPNARPRFSLDVLKYYDNRVNGGWFNMSSFDFKFLGFSGTWDVFNGLGCCNSGFPNCGASEQSITDLLNINTYRLGKIKTTVMYYDDKTDLSIPCVDLTNQNNIDYLENLTTELKVLNDSKYVTFNDINGQFIHIIPCNRNRVITNELGEEIQTTDTSKGVFTEFSGSMIFEMVDLPISSSGTRILTDRVKFKIPQNVDYYGNENIWIANYYTFNVNQIYTVGQFYNIDKNAQQDGFFSNVLNLGNLEGVINYLQKSQTTADFYSRPGVVILSQYDNKTTQNFNKIPTPPYKDDEGDFIQNPYYFNEFVINNNDYYPYYSPLKANSSNLSDSNISDTMLMGNTNNNLKGDVIFQEWLFGSLHFLQYGAKKYKNKRKTNYPTIFFNNYQHCYNNNDILGAGLKNTKNFISGQNFPTTFVPLGLVNVNNNNDVILQKDILIDLYEEQNLGLNLKNNGNINTLFSNNNKTSNKKFLFSKGLTKENDMVDRLIKLDII